jgi:hypothetical protein
MNRQRNATAVLALLLVAGALFATAALFLWTGSANFRLGLASSDWPSVPGTVVRSEVGESHGTIKGTASGEETEVTEAYYPIVAVRYVVGDTMYRTERIAYRSLEAHVGDRREVLAALARYPVGGEIPVHYDPQAPQRGVLEPGAAFGAFGASLIIGLVLAILGILALVFAIRTLRLPPRAVKG